MSTRLLACPNKCVNKFQDETYGQGIRVFNKTKQNSSDTSSWNCTVCGRDHVVGAPEKKRAKS